MINLSIILCCYNGRKRIRPTLEYLAAQKHALILQWEVVFVDNASTDGSADYAVSIWKEIGLKVPLRIVTESQPGLIYARIAGVRACQGKYIIFCDDDNWLREDYIQTAYELMEKMPNIGVLGGQSVLAPEVVAPDWWEEQQGNYAVGKQLRQSGVANKRGFLYGAGMVTRANLARRVFDERYPFILTGRKGTECLSGEDSEYCLRVMMLGYDLYYSEKLFYWHDIDPRRLTREQLDKLLHSFELGYKIQEKYRYALTYMQSSTMNHLKWLFIRIWNVLIASKAYITRKKALLHMHAYMMGVGRKDEEMRVIKGYIRANRI